MNHRLKAIIEKMEKLGIGYRILELGKKGITSEDVAQLSDKLKIKPREICKTLVVKTDKGKVFAVSLPGMMRLDNKKLRNTVKAKKIRMLRNDELKRETGFEPGTVCPVIIENMPLLVDKRVFETEKINTGSGDLYYGIEFDPKGLLKLGNVKVVDVSEDG